MKIFLTLHKFFPSRCRTVRGTNNRNRIVSVLTVFAVSILGMLLSATCVAQAVVTLPDAIKKALDNRKAIQAGREDLKIRQLQTQALMRKYWPQVSIDYTYQYNPILQTSILPIGVFNPAYPIDATKSVQFGTKWSQAAGITVNQPLLDLSIRRQRNEAELQEKITDAGQAQTEYDLAYTTAQAYVNIALQENKIKTAVTDTLRTWTSYKLQLDKYEGKRLLKSDLNKARINHNNTLQSLGDAIAQLVQNKVYLLFLTGETKLENVDFVIDTTFLTDMTLKKKGGRDQNGVPELQQLALQAQLADIQVKTERTKYIPTVSLKGFLGANQYTNDFNAVEPNTWYGLSYIGLNVKLPLLIGENKHNKMQQLHLQNAQLDEQRTDKTSQYYKDAVTANLKMQQVLTQMATLEDNIALEKETVGIIQDRVTEGVETAANLNTEEAALQAIESEYTTAQRQMWAYWLDYLKASGNLGILWK